MYDEAADVALHARQIADMDWALGQAQAVPDWPAAHVCDVGGGGGLRAAILTARARRVYCADIIDQQARYDGQFVKLLAEKLGRHGRRLAVDRFEAHVTDAMNLIYRDDLFDFVCSVNAFEHIPDPAKALAEMVRVLKPGGIAYVSFDPIWTADTGSHFSHRVKAPWAHLVLTEDEFHREMKAAGAEDWELQEFSTAMNRVRLPIYEELLAHAPQRFSVDLRIKRSWKGLTDEANVRHPNHARALCGYAEEELLTRGIMFVLSKKLKSPTGK